MSMRETASEFGTRLLALVVLVVGAWILLKLVIGVVAGIAYTVAIVLAVVAIIWALRVL